MTFDAQGQALDAPPRLSRKRIDLTTLKQVKTEMARVYRDMRFGRLRSDEGGRLVYVLSQIGKVIEVAEFDRRLERIEAAIAAGGAITDESQ